MHEAARALDLEAVVDHQHQHGAGHAQRAVQVSRGHRAVMRQMDVEDAQDMIQAGDPVHRDQVDRVHHGDPAEHHQCQRSDPRAIAVDDALGLVVNHLDDHFNEGLEAARHARGDAARGGIQEQHGDGAAQDRPEHRVIVDHGEIDHRRLLAADRVQVLQVFGDIAGGCQHVFRALGSFCHCRIERYIAKSSGRAPLLLCSARYASCIAFGGFAGHCDASGFPTLTVSGVTAVKPQ
ncbi:hypothetical protein D9M70_421490 [compost metagenome]